MMKSAFRILAIVVLAGTIALWAALGCSLGWTKTEIAVMKVDPVTEIEFATYEKRLAPGIDFLAAGCGAGLLLLATSVLFKKPENKHPKPS